MSVEVRTLAATRARVGESPLWLPEEGVWLWLDLQGREVHRYDPARAQDRIIASDFAEDLACLARGWRLVRLEDGWGWLATVGDGG